MGHDKTSISTPLDLCTQDDRSARIWQALSRTRAAVHDPIDVLVGHESEGRRKSENLPERMRSLLITSTKRPVPTRPTGKG